MGALVKFRDSELALIRRTVAKDCDAAEFDQFVHIAQAVGLDPLRKQIYAFVFGKKAKKPEDRRLTVVTAIDGYRAISERSGTYRPDENEPEIEYDPTLKGRPDNPLGIIKAKVTLWKFVHGAWHPVPGVAYWDEFVPTRYRKEDMERVQDGKWPDGNPKFREVPKDGAIPVVDWDKTGWIKSPRNQISKCAEAQAHRKGWPNDFAGTFVQEEIDRAHTIDLTASEIVERADASERMARIGGPALTIDWMDGNDLQRVPHGRFHDAAMAFVRTCEKQPGALTAWRERNRHALQEFWAIDKAAALSLKKAIEDFESKTIVAIAHDTPTSAPVIEDEIPETGGMPSSLEILIGKFSDATDLAALNDIQAQSQSYIATLNDGDREKARAAYGRQMKRLAGTVQQKKPEKVEVLA